MQTESRSGIPVLNSPIRMLFGLFLCLGLTSCASVPSPREPVPVEERGEGGAAPAGTAPAPAGVPAPAMEPLPEFVPLPAPLPSPQTTPPRPPAVLALLQRQESAARAGNPAQAAAELERALRISPNDGELWLRLARVRLTQKQWSQAESMGMKCLSLSGSDPATARSAWEVVATARAARGDAAGAATARRRAMELTGD